MRADFGEGFFRIVGDIERQLHHREFRRRRILARRAHLLNVGRVHIEIALVAIGVFRRSLQRLRVKAADIQGQMFLHRSWHDDGLVNIEMFALMTHRLALP